jgi:hypothetical protein
LVPPKICVGDADAGEAIAAIASAIADIMDVRNIVVSLRV